MSYFVYYIILLNPKPEALVWGRVPFIVPERAPFSLRVPFPGSSWSP